MTRDKRIALWALAVTWLLAAWSAWAAVSIPMPQPDMDGEIARQMLRLAWAACAGLLAGMGILIGVVWAQLNRRIKLDEDATRACFDETAKKVDSETLAAALARWDRFEERFYAHEKEDRTRSDQVMQAVANGQREVLGLLGQLIQEKKK